MRGNGRSLPKLGNTLWADTIIKLYGKLMHEALEEARALTFERKLNKFYESDVAKNKYIYYRSRNTCAKTCYI